MLSAQFTASFMPASAAYLRARRGQIQCSERLHECPHPDRAISQENRSRLSDCRYCATSRMMGTTTSNLARPACRSKTSISFLKFSATRVRIYTLKSNRSNVRSVKYRIESSKEVAGLHRSELDEGAGQPP